MSNETSKLRASRVLVPYVLLCHTCLTPYVLSCLVSYILSYPTCLFLHVHTCTSASFPTCSCVSLALPRFLCFVSQVASALLVHELEPKKNWYLGTAGGQNTIQIFNNLRVSFFLEKCDRLSESAAFHQKLRYFRDHNGAKCRPHENEF